MTRNQRSKRRRPDRLNRLNMHIRRADLRRQRRTLSASLNGNIISKAKGRQGVNNQVYQSRANVKPVKRVPIKSRHRIRKLGDMRQRNKTSATRDERTVLSVGLEREKAKKVLSKSPRRMPKLVNTRTLQRIPRRQSNGKVTRSAAAFQSNKIQGTAFQFGVEHASDKIRRCEISTRPRIWEAKTGRAELLGLPELQTGVARPKLVAGHYNRVVFDMVDGTTGIPAGGTSLGLRARCVLRL
ncbi:MAG: hypothetical protein Udaeo2_21000 [Candidatus Udaeobacter sp.]|nr:MAG: hypothetical protein Udaeo2_21000 [Candidatus Udaeobacter sp.]